MLEHARSSGISVALLLLLAGTVLPEVRGQTAGLGLNPAKVEIEVQPGEERTVGFRIDTPPSDVPVRGRLMLSLTDWMIDEQASVSYVEPGTLPYSASPWIVFSPADLSTISGESYLVRITVRVPPTAEPGVYRSGIFIQERPPATPPNLGQHLLYFRFRYAFTIYVIVPPVAGRGELVDVRLQRDPEGLRLVCELRNHGSRHLRPRISWSIQDAGQKEIASGKNKETTVLLPHSRMLSQSLVGPGLAPGRYEVSAQIDFNDGSFLQGVRRVIQIPAAEAVASSRPPEERKP
ncbi:MAG: hypothetical protein FJW35_14490 [Acidobacteria bacterium]|nr:hypothetical protein [Acidobacteriota bacterium]